MTKPEFLALVEAWAAAWDIEWRAGVEGVGDEVTLEDWLGSIDAFHALASAAAYQPEERP